MEIILHGGVKLRTFHADDATSLAEQANNPVFTTLLRDGFPYPYTLHDAENFIKLVQSDTKSIVVLCIDVEGKAVGSIGLTLKDNIHRYTAELGYWLGESYWNKGIMTRAVRKFTSYAFAELQLERIFAVPFPFNHSSQKVLLKAGFIHEATLKHSLCKDNIFYDELIFSLLKQDADEYISGQAG